MDIEPVMKFLPTYRLEPKVPLNKEVCEKIMKTVMDKTFQDFVYAPKPALSLCAEVSEEIKNRVKNLNFDRYRYIVVVSIGEKLYQGYYSLVNFLWDPEKDGYLSVYCNNNNNSNNSGGDNPLRKHPSSVTLEQVRFSNSVEKSHGGKAYNTPVASVSLLSKDITPAASFCLRYETKFRNGRVWTPLSSDIVVVEPAKPKKIACEDEELIRFCTSSNLGGSRRKR
uniref:Uncharacterized protein n=1 Tax=Glossina pallidipes TaxID=7398 RepID=A0A1A9ZKW8_GLOPL